METTKQTAVDQFQFWRYADLVERRIVKCRSDLHYKQKLHGFPKPYHLGEGGPTSAALFRVAEVTAWIEARMARAKRIEAAE